MIEKNDWRLQGQESYLTGANLQEFLFFAGRKHGIMSIVTSAGQSLVTMGAIFTKDM